MEGTALHASRTHVTRRILAPTKLSQRYTQGQAMTKLKLVTIIAEAILEDRLVRELRRLGARGYTVTGVVRGEGARGNPAIVDPGGQNVRIETLVSAEIASRISAYIADHYFSDYAVIIYILEAEVLRSDKYL